MDSGAGLKWLSNHLLVANVIVYCPNLKIKKDIVQCKHCPNAPVTTDWQGYVIILNPKRSEVAARLNVTSPGTYALKVNIR